MLCSLGHVALFDSSQTWVVEHPQTLFAWEGACIWIPCTYRMPVNNANLNKILLYQKYEFDNNTKDFTGTVLYNNTEIGSSPSKHGRVTFLGNRNSNCTLEILEMRESDRGQLGLRMISGTNKWMEHIYLNISSKYTCGTLHPGSVCGAQHPGSARGTLHPVSVCGTLHPVSAHGTLHPILAQAKREVRVLSCMLTVKSQTLGPMAEQSAYLTDLSGQVLPMSVPLNLYQSHLQRVASKPHPLPRTLQPPSYKLRHFGYSPFFTSAPLDAAPGSPLCPLSPHLPLTWFRVLSTLDSPRSLCL